MNFEYLNWIALPLGVTVFFALERFVESHSSSPRGRISSILVIAAIGMGLSVALSLLLLAPLVFLIAPLEAISLSRIDAPPWIVLPASFLALDFAHYLVHRIHHAIPVLWRVHRLHHSDVRVDSMTTFLQHPLEVTSSFFLIVGFSVLFDIPIVVLFAYGVVFGLQAGFAHFSRPLPESLDRFFRYVIITPNIHRIHHSNDFEEGNRNFGAMFIFWDLLFGTYCHLSNEQLMRTKFGVGELQSPKANTVYDYLSNPLRS
jgi:sterol desaturase/sphingolipid hydroxylase (fatty acid hydroxylase superfamily)